MIIITISTITINYNYYYFGSREGVFYTYARARIC